VLSDIKYLCIIFLDFYKYYFLYEDIYFIQWFTIYHEHTLFAINVSSNSMDPITLYLGI